ncbi:YgaP family membrane protein [Joostella sp. CR20]|uniref:YgaP family membrane protein n=1 Tax=Joostella sp. CR20 TaxID=2804312 RepID=UPI00313C7EE4
MKKNIGQKDKLIRVVIAFVIALLFYFQIISGLFGVACMLFAIVLLLSCLFRFSLVYKLFGFDTNKENNQRN